MIRERRIPAPMKTHSLYGTLDEELMKAAKSQGRCDGRWGARCDPGDFEGRQRDAYLAEHAEGRLDREREPHRWGGQ